MSVKTFSHPIFVISFSLSTGLHVGLWIGKLALFESALSFLGTKCAWVGCEIVIVARSRANNPVPSMLASTADYSFLQ